MIANKMESNGTEGCITVSQKTMELLMKAFPDSFVFSYHKDVHLQSFNQTVKSFRILDIRKDSGIFNEAIN